MLVHNQYDSSSHTSHVSLFSFCKSCVPAGANISEVVARPPPPHTTMIRSQLRQLAQHGDRAWTGLTMPVRHFSASSAAASEGPSPPAGMRYTQFPLTPAPLFY
jgi:hypothetical protein